MICVNFLHSRRVYSILPILETAILTTFISVNGFECAFDVPAFDFRCFSHLPGTVAPSFWHLDPPPGNSGGGSGPPSLSGFTTEPLREVTWLLGV